MSQQGSAGTASQLGPVFARITANLVSADQRGAAALGLVTEACAALLGELAVGIMLVDPRGGTEVVFASDEQTRFLEVLQSQIEQGPCFDCINTGELIAVPDLNAEQRWPAFTTAALDAGYQAVHAVPMRLAGRAIGGMNLLYHSARELDDGEQELVQALADLAVIGISQESDPQHRWDRVTEQTLSALNDRVMIAQAVGLIVGTLDIDPVKARTLLNRHARDHHLSVQLVSRAITQGTLAPSTLGHHSESAGTAD